MRWETFFLKMAFVDCWGSFFDVDQCFFVWWFCFVVLISNDFAKTVVYEHLLPVRLCLGRGPIVSYFCNNQLVVDVLVQATDL